MTKEEFLKEVERMRKLPEDAKIVVVPAAIKLDKSRYLTICLMESMLQDREKLFTAAICAGLDRLAKDLGAMIMGIPKGTEKKDE